MTVDATPNEATPRGPAPLTLAVRQRLQQVFERGRASQQRGDSEYAHQLYSECVVEDPGNLVYAQQMRSNLGAYTGAGRRGMLGGLRSRSAPSAMLKAITRGAWREAFTLGCAALSKNPGDLATLLAMADACGQLDRRECQLFYLRWALDIDAKDVEVNRQAGIALEQVGQFEQAISCWQRVQHQKPGDEESAKAMSRLSVEHAIKRGGYNADLLQGAADVEARPAVRVSDLAQSDGKGDSVSAGDEAVRLQAAIDADPADPEAYLQLADVYASAGRLEKASKLLTEALSATGGGDLRVREKWEDVELCRVHAQVKVADRRAAEEATPEAKHLARQMLAQATQAELEIFAARADRHPADPRPQIELAVRFKKLGKHREAIPYFQKARGDRKRAAEVQLHLGECFQHIEQYKLALASYTAGLEACDPASEDLYKLLLYRAGVLASGMREFERAEKCLTDLAAIDFGYRDVGDRLDKLARMRQNP
ncbi:Tetratricopeptide repeat protein [Pirellulimonas nuda]|uniref:Tetratricopeptide repeat protein n=1 Tax=Pirellulimonas nuda TaxID=2528009 RepID=A0A518D821_9BACT|nr:tetratricopeptide repeat protein [Pirellulimonas nuda]QDU87608.1 Tetratricopeptide repeat protein [Pirellulimonas nuda]